MELFKNIITESDCYFGIPDCFFEGEDYKELFEQAFNLTEGFLSIRNLSFENLPYKWSFKLTVNNKEYPVILKKLRGNLDDVAFYESINAILIDEGYKGDKRFCSVADGNKIELGVGFITKEIEYRLIKEGLIVRDEDWIEQDEYLKYLNKQ